MVGLKWIFIEKFLRLCLIAAEEKSVIRTDQLAGSQVAMQTSQGGRDPTDFFQRLGPEPSEFGILVFYQCSQGNEMKEADLLQSPLGRLTSIKQDGQAPDYKNPTWQTDLPWYISGSFWMGTTSVCFSDSLGCRWPLVGCLRRQVLG